MDIENKETIILQYLFMCSYKKAKLCKMKKKAIKTKYK